MLPVIHMIINRQILRNINLFIIQRHDISDRLIRLAVIYPMQIFITGIRNFFNVFGYFDLRLLHIVFKYGSHLIHTAKNRRAFGTDKVFSHSHAVDLRTLRDQRSDQVFIERIADHDIAVFHPRSIQCFPYLLRKIRHIPAVDAHAF